MWSGHNHNKVWLHYVKNIIAADLRSAKFLAAYEKFSRMNNTHLPYIEIIDLNNYKVIKKKDKLKKALQKCDDTPFVFVVGKN
jgi:hypothetical protein